MEVHLIRKERAYLKRVKTRLRVPLSRSLGHDISKQILQNARIANPFTEAVPIWLCCTLLKLRGPLWEGGVRLLETPEENVMSSAKVAKFMHKHGFMNVLRTNSLDYIHKYSITSDDKVEVPLEQYRILVQNLILPPLTKYITINTLKNKVLTFFAQKVAILLAGEEFGEDYILGHNSKTNRFYAKSLVSFKPRKIDKNSNAYKRASVHFIKRINDQSNRIANQNKRVRKNALALESGSKKRLHPRVTLVKSKKRKLD